MDIKLTTNTEIVLDIEQINFEKYINILIDFWEGFPEHLTSIIEIE